jgi:hypothetical protein
VKATLEIPDALFRKAKSTAAERGQTLKEFVTDAVREKLADRGDANKAAPSWMRFFGAGKDFADSIREIDREIEKEFEQVEHAKPRCTL